MRTPSYTLQGKKIDIHHIVKVNNRINQLADQLMKDKKQKELNKCLAS